MLAAKENLNGVVASQIWYNKANHKSQQAGWTRYARLCWRRYIFWRKSEH